MRRKMFLILLLLFSASVLLPVGLYAGDIMPAKAIFDMRMGNAKSVALNLDLIQQTYKDMGKKTKPSFTVVFIGPSVKLISKNRAGFSPEDQKHMEAIAARVSEMAKDGIRLEL